MNTVRDVRLKITEALNEKIYETGSGAGFNILDADLAKIGGMYCKAIGVVDGLKLSLDIINRLERGDSESATG